MSVLNRFYESFSLSHSNYILHNFKCSKYNFKYRKLYICCQLRKANSSDESQIKEHINISNFIPFESMIHYRRNEAKRSIGVQVQSKESGKELYHYCKGIAPVNSMFHYNVNNNHYFLVEFSEDCSDVLEKCTFSKGAGTVPVKSPFLWFKASKQGGKLRGANKKGPIENELPLKHSMIPTQDEVNEWLEQSCTLSDSMKVLFESNRLDELGLRLRLLTARQIEMALEGLFPNIAVLPFGSTVNGLGKAGCDLDLVVQHDFEYQTHSEDTSSSRLMHHCKSAGNSAGSRHHVQRQMEVLADLIQLYLPGCYSIKRILQARVPIVKFSHEVTGVDCDLSMTNMTGVYMSELLYLFGCLDPLARPLVFTIKQWAWAIGLTNPTPGRWVTNFTLTLLTLFYLQVVNRLPSIDLLRAAAGAEDKRVTEEIDCTFIRDLSRLKWQSLKSSDQDLSDLLKGFFDYYIRFDFTSSGISLNAGKCVPKPDVSPVYVVNPLEKYANVSKNVSLEEVERLRIALRDAAWSLETMENDQKLFINLVSRPTNVSENLRRKYIPNNKILSIKRLFTER